MNTALILSGGKGTRIGGDIPKQYIDVEGKPLIYYTLKTILQHEMIDAVWVVAEKQFEAVIKKAVDDIADESGSESIRKLLHGFSKPGENRQLSILNGLRDIRKVADDADTVLIHDAARPKLKPEMISECYAAIIGHEGVLPVLPMKDTIYLSSNGQRISSLLDRSRVFAGQAPELFLIGKYYEANQELLPDRIMDIHGSTEPAVMAGMDVVLIPGDEGNSKITTAYDLEEFRKSVMQR